MMPEKAGKKSAARRAARLRWLGLRRLAFEGLDACLGVGERVFLDEQGLGEQIGCARCLGRQLADEVVGFAVLVWRTGFGGAQTVEQAGDEIVFFGSHGSKVRTTREKRRRQARRT